MMTTTTTTKDDKTVIINALDQCRNGFDESILFQVPITNEIDQSRYWRGIQEKSELKEDFRLKFRNISRIMDCVTCEKCRVWGKLQILGIGTAIKILLTPESELSIRSSDTTTTTNNPPILNRQEIIALINILNQLSKSILFATHASQLELTDKITDFTTKYIIKGILPTLFILILVAIIFRYVRNASGRSSSSGIMMSRMNKSRIDQCIHESNPDRDRLIDLADGMKVDLPEGFTPNGDAPGN